jgi:hypothetical protein
MLFAPTALMVELDLTYALRNMDEQESTHIRSRDSDVLRKGASRAKAWRHSSASEIHPISNFRLQDLHGKTTQGVMLYGKTRPRQEQEPQANTWTQDKSKMDLNFTFPIEEVCVLRGQCLRKC